MGRHPSVLITGGDGQVGRALRALLPDADAPGHGELDVTDARAVSAATKGVAVLVHLAALTDVDHCEAEPAAAEHVNVDGTDNVVDAAETHGARIVFLSTDYVFDGSAQRPYREEDPTAPLNVYGRTKLMGEQLVTRVQDSLIIRSSWIFGEGRNFVGTMLRAGRDRESVRVVDDQRGLPTSAKAVAVAIVAALDTGVSGCLHVAGTGPVVSWAEFARAALERAGSSTRVVPISTEEYRKDAQRAVAPRPAFSPLDTTRAWTLGIPLLDWRTELEAYVGAKK